MIKFLVPYYVWKNLFMLTKSTVELIFRKLRKKNKKKFVLKQIKGSHKT